MNTLSHQAVSTNTDEVAGGPLSAFEKSQTKKEALSAAARKGGVLTIHGTEIQAKGSLFDEKRSLALEGALLKVSEQVTRKAQVLILQQQGLTLHEIIKAVWHVEDGPHYLVACEEYREFVAPMARRHF
jgi:hypothetical protein